MHAAYDPDYGTYLGHPLDPRTPDDDTTACESCGGTGKVTDTTEYANGPSPYKVDCERCDGLGRFDEEGVPFRLLANGERDYGRGFAQ